MQQPPVRLVQAIRTTFQASRPVPRPPRSRLILAPRSSATVWRPASATLSASLRFYVDSKRGTVGRDERVGLRGDDTTQSRVEKHQAQTEDGSVTPHADTQHVASSTSDRASLIREDVPPASTSPEQSSDPTLPSETSSRRSPLSQRFGRFMDNIQSNIFTASRRLNDLTGYTGIERLKNSIDEQESLVSSARRAVKELRNQYSIAVATRAATQREVNDLLHRKHNWSPQDLERFTSLYRSDHANEQAEIKAAAELSEAESRYEEASTKLGRTILARYHEEQIWSDKIRQMSTWGTWGLMGLNVLLFVVFQIAIEPWRRKRLVRGFEEKVEEALAATDNGRNSIAGAMTGEELASKLPEHHAQGVADSLAGAIVDAVTGAAPPDPNDTAKVEADIENLTTHELTSEGPTSMGKEGDDLSFPKPIIGEPSDFTIPPSSTPSKYADALRELFSEKAVVVTQKELTAVAVEGAVAGAALVGLLLVLLRPR